MRAIRKGALAYTGSISNSGSGLDTQVGFMNGIYYYNYPLGQAFTDKYNVGYDRAMHVLLGDPTIIINPIWLSGLLTL